MMKLREEWIMEMLTIIIQLMNWMHNIIQLC